jgi:hypothetical protein
VTSSTCSASRPAARSPTAPPAATVPSRPRQCATAEATTTSPTPALGR